MLKDLFEAICQQARQTVCPKVIETPEPRHHYALMGRDGEIEWISADPSPRQHKTSRLDTVIALALQEASVSPHPVIWYSRDAVTLFFDDTTRRDTLKMPLAFHPQFLTLKKLEESKPLLNQKQLLRLLRIELNDCAPPALLETLRKVRFKKTEDGSGVLLHTKASLGRAIETELTLCTSLPETVEISVPVFNNGSSARYGVACAIEVDTDEEKFQLVPLPGQIEAAIHRAEDNLCVAIVEAVGDAVPVYCGSP